MTNSKILTEILQLIKRHLILNLFLIFSITAFTSFYLATPPEYLQSHTAFLTITPERGTSSFKNDTMESFLGIQAADYFSETFMGWLKDPAILQEIEKQNGFTLPITIKKQEKQNLILSFKSNFENTENFYSTIKNTLQKKLDDFNSKSSIDFNFISGNLSNTPIKKNLIQTLAISILIFLLTSPLLSFLSELIKGKLSLSIQLSNLFPNNKIFLTSTKNTKTTIEQITNQSIKKIELQENPSFIKYIQFFQLNNPNRSIIILKAGKTNLNDLQFLENQISPSTILIFSF